MTVSRGAWLHPFRIAIRTASSAAAGVPDRNPSASAVGLQTHAAVIHQTGLGDRGVTRIERQLERQRWSGPFSGVHFGNIFLHVLGLIVGVGLCGILMMVTV